MNVRVGTIPSLGLLRFVALPINSGCRDQSETRSCSKKQEAIKVAREERRTWKEREGERRNVTTDQQKKPDQVEDGGPSTAEAEKKAQDDEQTVKEPEVQVVATQETEGESSNAGTQETPMKSW